MNIVGQIKKSFSFLKGYKFKRKIYSGITDYEIVYSKEDLQILIYYSLCVPEEIVKEYGNDYKKILNESYFSVGVVIQKAKIRSNILESTLFSNEKRTALKDAINKIPNNNVLELIDTYSKFLRNNIICLFN